MKKAPMRLHEDFLYAPQVGLEPTTTRLTAECSAIELLRNMKESGDDLLSRAVSSQVPSALRGLTSVFGMGTGVTLSSLPPKIVNYFDIRMIADSKADVKIFCEENSQKGGRKRKKTS